MVILRPSLSPAYIASANRYASRINRNTYRSCQTSSAESTTSEKGYNNAPEILSGEFRLLMIELAYVWVLVGLLKKEVKDWDAMLDSG
jgi:hypothetical protein